MGDASARRRTGRQSSRTIILRDGGAETTTTTQLWRGVVQRRGHAREPHGLPRQSQIRKTRPCRAHFALGCFLAGAVAVPASQYSRKTLQQHHEEPYAPCPRIVRRALLPSLLHAHPFRDAPWSRLQGAQVTTAALCGRSDAPRLAVASYRASSAQLWLQGANTSMYKITQMNLLANKTSELPKDFTWANVSGHSYLTPVRNQHPNLLRLMLGVRAHFGPGGPVQCHDDGDGEGHARSRSLDAERAQLRK